MLSFFFHSPTFQEAFLLSFFFFPPSDKNYLLKFAFQRGASYSVPEVDWVEYLHLKNTGEKFNFLQGFYCLFVS